MKSPEPTSSPPKASNFKRVLQYLASSLSGLIFSRKTPEGDNKQNKPQEGRVDTVPENHSSAPAGPKEQSLEDLAKILSTFSPEGGRQTNPANPDLGPVNNPPVTHSTANTTTENTEKPSDTPLVPTKEQLESKIMLKLWNETFSRFNFNPLQSKSDFVHTQIPTSQKFKRGKSLTYNIGDDNRPPNPTLLRAQKSLGVKDPDKRTERGGVSTDLVPLSSIKDVFKPTVPLSSLQIKKGSNFQTTMEIRKEESLVSAKEPKKEGLDTSSVPFEEMDESLRKELGQNGIDTSPLNTNSSPGHLPPSSDIRMRRSLTVNIKAGTAVDERLSI